MSTVELDFKIQAQQATQQLRNLNQSVQKVGESVSTTRLAIANAFGQAIVGSVKVAASAIFNFSKTAIQAASDAEETSSKFATVFKDISASSDKTAKDLAKNFGLSTTAAKQLLGDTGDLLTGFGFTQKGALELSNGVQELAVDLASFTNFSGGAAGASAALTKALLGETESLKSLGISINQEDIKKQVAINTSKGLTFATERQAKAQATLDLAMAQSGNAIGDFARTSQGFANQQRILSNVIQDVTESLGSQLLPVANLVLGSLITLFRDNQKEVIAWVQNGMLIAIEAMINFIPYINSTISAFKLLGDALILMKDAVVTGFWAIETAIAAVLLGVVAAVEAAVNALPDSLVPDGWKENLAIAKDALVATTEEMANNTADSADKMAENFNDVGKSFENTISNENLDKLKGKLEEVKGAVQENSDEIVAIKSDETTKVAAIQTEDQKAKLEREAAFQEELKALQDEAALLKEEERIAKEEEELTRTDEKFANLVEELGRENAIRIQAAQNLGAGQAEIETLKTKAEIDNSKARIKNAEEEEKRKSKIQDRQAKQFQLVEKAKVKFDEGTWDDRANQTRAGLGALAGLQNSSNKAAFAVGKSAAIAQATISTYQSATLAFSSLAGIPIVGPVLGGIAAAAAVVSGLAQISKIKSTKPPTTSTFADGGIVGGNSFSGDKVPAFVNSGEMVLNTQQQAQLFNQANGGESEDSGILSAITSLGDRIANMEVVITTSDYEIGRSVNRALDDGLVLQTS